VPHSSVDQPARLFKQSSQAPRIVLHARVLDIVPLFVPVRAAPSAWSAKLSFNRTLNLHRSFGVHLRSARSRGSTHDALQTDRRRCSTAATRRGTEYQHGHRVKPARDRQETREVRLDQAFIFEERIDRATYERHSVARYEEQALLEQRRHECCSDEALDLDGLLTFAEYVLADPAGLWIDWSLNQRATILLRATTARLSNRGNSGVSRSQIELSEHRCGGNGDSSPTGFEASPRSTHRLLVPAA
jgi:hypothetical protein